MPNEDKQQIYAEIIFRSRTGGSLIKDAQRVTPNNLQMYQAESDNPALLKQKLEKAGFSIIVMSRFGASISGPEKAYQDFFKVKLAQHPVKMFSGGRTEFQATPFFFDDTPTIPRDITALAEHLYIPRMGYFLAGEGAMPATSYYALRPPPDITALTNADHAHQRGYQGNGVKVGMVDSGFIADHDYYNGKGYNVTVHTAVGSATMDEYGHGTGVASNLLAIAPRCEFHFFKMSDGNQWASLAAFRMAVQAGVKVITCSWGQIYDPVLEAEILQAITGDGITVIFACGNTGTIGWPGCEPDVISVGGAYPVQGGGWVASSYASSGTNSIFPNRHCPDFCGIVGQGPMGIFIVMPTMVASRYDQSFSGGPFPNGDETGPRDGWLVASGTSSAAPQVAGAAALLLQAKSNLSPAEIKQTLADTCTDVVQGTSASGEQAGVGPDSATGAGVINIGAAVDKVAPAVVCPSAPYIPCSIAPTACVRAPLVACPPGAIQCYKAPFVCSRAPIYECYRGPTIECPSAPVINRCPPGPSGGCLAGPVLEPVDPRDKVTRPAVTQTAQTVQGTPRGRFVPVVVMVAESELETWIAQEAAYAAYNEIGMKNEYSSFPDPGTAGRGKFNPSTKGESGP